MRSEFRVTGMTCEHCEQRVSREVEAVPGVTRAVADATAGSLIVTAESTVDVVAIADAVDEAGYVLVDG